MSHSNNPPLTFNKKLLKERLKKYEKEKQLKIQLPSIGFEVIPKLILTSTHFATIVELDMTSNLLTNLPPKFNKLIKLEILILTNNKFSEFPDVIFSIGTLRKLDLANNYIRAVPSTIKQLQQLRSLNLSENQLESLPNEVNELIYLKELNTTGNFISPVFAKVMQARNKSAKEINLTKLNLYEIPGGISNLAGHLQSLTISNNMIQTLDIELFTLTKLQVLELRNNKLTEIHPMISQLKGLEILGLAENRIKDFPEEISSLTSLKLLNISNNLLAFIPEPIYKLTNLQDLYMANNGPGIAELDCEKILQLKQLKFLSLKFNRITQIHNFLSVFLHQKSNLKSINFSGNPLDDDSLEGLFGNRTTENEIDVDIDISETRISPHLQHIFQNYCNKNIKKLNISQQNLTKLPDELIHLKNNIVEVAANGNSISEVPDFLNDFLHLEVLSISSNSLNSLPLDSVRLTKIIEIDASSNQFSSFPKEICSFSQLAILNLENNKIKQIPAEIEQLKCLSELNLSKNELESLPKQFFQLLELRVVKMENNQLKTIPGDFIQLKNLEELRLSGNKIEVIPIALTELQKLTALHLDENHISKMPEKILFHTWKTLSFENNQIAPVKMLIFKLLRRTGREINEINFSNLLVTELPEEFNCLPKIYSLNLSNNSMEFFKINFANLMELETLNLSRNLLLSISVENNEKNPIKLANLTNVNCSENFLRAFPVDLLKFDGIKKLNLAANKIRSFPSLDSFQLSNLTELDLSRNKLRYLDEEFISSLPNLIHLNFSNNLLSEINFNSFFSLLNLREMNFSGNQISKLLLIDKKQFPALKPAENPENEEEIENENFQIYTIIKNQGNSNTPVENTDKISENTIFKKIKTFFKNLNILDLSKNLISVIPNELIYFFHKIKSLHVEDNLFLPMTFENILKPIRNHPVDYSFLKLRNFPMFLLYFKSKLNQINFSGNQFHSISDKILFCSTLQFIDVSFNYLVDLSVFAKLENLLEINANNNLIDEFPSYLVRLKYLKRLFLSNNKIKDLPPSAFDFPSLKILFLVNNLISSPPPLPLLRKRAPNFLILRKNPLQFPPNYFSAPSPPLVPCSPSTPFPFPSSPPSSDFPGIFLLSFPFPLPFPPSLSLFLFFFLFLQFLPITLCFLPHLLL